MDGSEIWSCICKFILKFRPSYTKLSPFVGIHFTNFEFGELFVYLSICLYNRKHSICLYNRKNSKFVLRENNCRYFRHAVFPISNLANCSFTIYLSIRLYIRQNLKFVLRFRKSQTHCPCLTRHFNMFK